MIKTISIDAGHYTVMKSGNIIFTMAVDPDQETTIEEIINSQPDDHLHFA